MAKRKTAVGQVAKKLGLPRKPDKNVITLSSGISIRLRFFAPTFYQELLQDALERWPEPEVPIVRVNAFDGEHDEPNPNDSGYLAAVEKTRSAQARYVTDALLLLGVECDVPAEWRRRMEKLGKVLPKDADELRLYYLKQFALVREQDYSLVIRSLARGVTVTEEGVAEAAARFKSDLPQPSPDGLSAAEVRDSRGSGVGDGRDRAGLESHADAVPQPANS